MMPSITAEWCKLWSVRAPAICLVAACLLAPAAAFTVANDVAYGARSGGGPTTTAAPLELTGSALQFALAMLVAFAMLTVTGEYANGSIRSSLLAEPRRWIVLAAKTAVVSCVGVAVGAVLSLLSYEIVDAVLGDQVAPEADGWSVAVRGGALVGLACVLTCGVAAVVRSSVGTMATSFGLLVGTLAVPDPLGSWLPAGAGADLMTGSDGSPAVGAAVLLLWALTTWAVGCWVLERRDA